MALVPWPNKGTQAHTAAVEKLISVASVKTDERACDLGMAAAELIQRYAPGAPQASKDEALVRYAGYLAQTRQHGLTKISAGSVDLEFTERSHAAAFQHSGAKALLSPWRVRRAGVIE